MLCLLIITSVSVSVRAQEVWTLGPMIHINFGGGEKISTSFSIEGAYWNLNNFITVLTWDSSSIVGSFESILKLKPELD
jgi:hypothetical protein